MKHTRLAAFLLMTAAIAFAQSTAAEQATNAGQPTKTAKGEATPPKPQVPAAPAPVEPLSSGEPYTEMLDTANSPAAYDPLLEPHPLPRASLSLIGGNVRKVDAVHNRLTLQPFGGGNKYMIYFDDRTRILSGGRETTVLAIHPGDRVYADTQALGAQVFARTIQVRTKGGSAQASGQVLENLSGQVRMQDRLSGETIRFQVSDRTKVESRKGAVASAGELQPGSLIDVTFAPGGRRNEAQSIMIHASPGESYVFAGVLTHVNLRDGVLALDNQVDGNNYELYFDPLAEKGLDRLVEGTPVSVTASFDGKRYSATSIKITEVPSNLESRDR
jgi:hypothetical protein